MSFQINQKKFLDDHEANLLNQTLSRFMLDNPDRYLPILLAIKTGCRKPELLKLKVENLNVRHKTILIQGTKRSNDREIPLEPMMIDSLLSYIQRTHLESEDRLFKFSERQIGRIWWEVRPVKKCFHSLRHTFAINVFKFTKDIQLVMKALGHKKIENTMVYANYAYSVDEMKQIMYWDQK